MSIKASKKMNGFMCHSTAATAVCTVGDPRSIVVPRKPDRFLVDDKRLTANAKYSRLVHHHHHHHHHRQRLPPLPPPPPPPPPPLAHKRSSSSASLVSSSIIKKDDAGQLMKQKPAATSQQLQLGSSDQVFQVVVMRVALHCQGCAGKVKKHLSKMEGVKSFSIDLETKRVTVVGHVSPVGVLESVSKVKRAEFWSCS